MSRERRPTATVAYLLVAFAALCWAGNHVLGRAIAGHVPPLAISAVRWLAPAIVLLPFALPHLRRDWHVIRQHWLSLLLLCLAGGALFGALQYLGLVLTTAINVSVLNSISPIAMVAAGGIIFRDRIDWRQGLGVAISLGGVLAIVAKGDFNILRHLAFNWGDLIILFNMIVFGVYSACLRLRPAMHWMSFLYVLAFVSALATLPFAVAEHYAGDRLVLDWSTLGALAYASIFPTVAANAAWNRGVDIIGSGRAGIFLHLIPVYSVLLAGLLLGERLQLHHLAGFALIMTGIWLATRDSGG